MWRGYEPHVRDQGEDDPRPRVNEESSRAAHDVARVSRDRSDGTLADLEAEPVARRLPGLRSLGCEQERPRTVGEARGMLALAV